MRANDSSVSAPVAIEAPDEQRHRPDSPVHDLTSRFRILGLDAFAFCRSSLASPQTARRVQSLLSGLQEDEQEVANAARRLEQRFLAAGNGIRQLTELSQRLLEQSQALANVFGHNSRGREVLDATLELIQQQLSFLEQCQSANARVIDKMEEFAKDVRSLQRCASSFSRVLAPLVIIATLYKIESAGLTGDEKEFFVALTDDITCLQHQANLALDDELKALEQTETALDQTIPRIKERALSQASRLNDAKQRLGQILSEFRNLSAQNEARHARVTQAGKEAFDSTGPAVVGLQYQDITRQKWEHVAHALSEMRARSEFASLGGLRLKREPLAFLRETSRLQLRQLAAIDADIAQAQAVIIQSIYNMLLHLRDMDAECRQMCGGAPGSVPVEQMVKVLQDTLKELSSWMEEITSDARATSDTVTTLKKSASNVVSTLRRLSAEIKLIAVNAQVQSTRVGGKTGLEVLSEHTCTVAREIQQFSEIEAQSFNSADTDLKSIVQQCLELRESAQVRRNALETEGTRMSADLSAYCAQTLAIQRELAECRKKLHEAASEALDTLGFHDSIAEGFERLHTTLDTCSSLADTLLGKERRATDITSQIEALGQTYTMESERALHASVLAETETPGAPQPASAEPTAPDATIPSPSASPDAPVEPEAALAEVSAAKAEQSNLGDNIELF